MEVNKNNYPDIGEVSAIDGVYSGSPYFGNNSKIDDSSCIGVASELSPFSNTYGFIPQLDSTIKINRGLQANNVTRLFLAYAPESIPALWQKEANGNLIEGAAKWGYGINTAPAYADKLKIVTAFDFNKIIVCPQITALEEFSDNSRSVTSSINEYIEKYKNEYPYILSITLPIYAGNAGNRNLFSLHILPECDLSNYEVDENVQGNILSYVPYQLKDCLIGAYTQKMDRFDSSAGGIDQIPTTVMNVYSDFLNRAMGQGFTFSLPYFITAYYRTSDGRREWAFYNFTNSLSSFNLTLQNNGLYTFYPLVSGTRYAFSDSGSSVAPITAYTYIVHGTLGAENGYFYQSSVDFTVNNEPYGDNSILQYSEGPAIPIPCPPNKPFEYIALNTFKYCIAWNVSAYSANALYQELCNMVNNSIPLYWCEDNAAVNAVLGTDCTNDLVHLPQIDINGILNGDMVSGEDLASNERAQILEKNVNAPFTNNGYTEASIDDNKYIDSVELTTPSVPINGQFNRSYIMALTHIKDLSDYIWNADDSRIEEMLNGLKLFGENPINGIIDLRLYPFDLSAIVQQLGTPEFIKIGRAVSSAIGYKINQSYPVIDLGSCIVYRYNKNFLDFSPYTEAELYIPFIGKIPIDTNIFMGHVLSVKLIVDIITGVGVAVVFADNIPIIYEQGTIGVSIPITGDNAAQYANGIISSVINSSSEISRSIGGGVQGAISAGINSTENIAGSILSPVTYQHAGSSSPACAMYQPNKCYLIIYQANPAYTSGYGHTIGKACRVYDKIVNFTGFSVFANPDLSGIVATDSEKERIYQLLTNGVFI